MPRAPRAAAASCGLHPPILARFVADRRGQGFEPERLRGRAAVVRTLALWARSRSTGSRTASRVGAALRRRVLPRRRRRARRPRRRERRGEDDAHPRDRGRRAAGRRHRRGRRSARRDAPVRRLHPRPRRRSRDLLRRGERARDPGVPTPGSCAAERARRRVGTAEAGIRLANAWAHWGDVGGYDAEVLWDACTVAAMRASVRRRSRAEPCSHPLRWRAEAARARGAVARRCRRPAPRRARQLPRRARQGVARGRRAPTSTTKTVLFVSHDRELLERTGAKIVTLEGRGAWTHGGDLRHLARGARRRGSRGIDEEHRRWQEERRTSRIRSGSSAAASQMSDTFACRLRATNTQDRAFDTTRAAPRERPQDQIVACGSTGDRTGKRAVVVERAELPRAHRSVRHRGAVRRAGRRARTQRHRQEPLPRSCSPASPSSTRVSACSARASCPATSRRPTSGPNSTDGARSTSCSASGLGCVAARWPRCGATSCSSAWNQVFEHAVGRSAGAPADPPARAVRLDAACCSTNRPTTSTSPRPRRSSRRSPSFEGTVLVGHPRPLVHAALRPVPRVPARRLGDRVARAGLGLTRVRVAVPCAVAPPCATMGRSVRGYVGMDSVQQDEHLAAPLGLLGR